MTFEIFGYLSSFCFIVCGIPQAIICFRTGKAFGLSHIFLWAWTLGEVFLALYACLSLNFDIPLLLNAAFNAICLLIIFKYLYWPRKETKVL